MVTALRPKWGLGLVVIAMAAVAVLVTSCGGGPSGAGPRVGATAPDFTLTTLDGGTLTLDQFRGKPVFLNFWTTWCPACREEMPYIQELLADQESYGFVVLTVDLAESPATVRGFMEKESYTFPVGLDTSGQVGNMYNVTGLPTTYLIDSQGVIRRVKVGPFVNKDAMLKEMRALR